MIWQILAILVLVIHLLFILYVVAGALLVFRYPVTAWIHIPAAVWGAWIEFAGWICPLTPLENKFLRLAGKSGYETGFIEHYLLSLIYHDLPDRNVQFLLGGIVVVINVVIYSIIIARKLRARKYFRQING